MLKLTNLMSFASVLEKAASAIMLLSSSQERVTGVPRLATG